MHCQRVEIDVTTDTTATADILVMAGAESRVVDAIFEELHKLTVFIGLSFRNFLTAILGCAYPGQQKEWHNCILCMGT